MYSYKLLYRRIYIHICVRKERGWQCYVIGYGLWSVVCFLHEYLSLASVKTGTNKPQRSVPILRSVLLWRPAELPVYLACIFSDTAKSKCPSVAVIQSNGITEGWSVKNIATDGNCRILHLNFQPNFTCVGVYVRPPA